jgi:hypothetical protein
MEAGLQERYERTNRARWCGCREVRAEHRAVGASDLPKVRLDRRQVRLERSDPLPLLVIGASEALDLGRAGGDLRLEAATSDDSLVEGCGCGPAVAKV